jgi:nitroreductase
MATPEYAQADIARCVDSVLQARRSVRAYKPDAVPRSTVLEVLRAASTCAPSNSNTQPWRVHVLSGETKRALGEALVAAFRQGELPPSAHFPDPLPQAFGDRQADFASRYYDSLGIARDDMRRAGCARPSATSASSARRWA